ncbi:membrane protein [Streptomyces litmocidini]|nr:membrane protein [Streptomyces litmocidini]
MTITAYALAVLLDLLVLFVGARFLHSPYAAASGYGVASTSGGPTAYLRIKGLRDSSYGLLGLALLAFAGPRAEAWYMLVVALLPLGYTFIVLRNGGSRRPPSASTSPPLSWCW